MRKNRRKEKQRRAIVACLAFAGALALLSAAMAGLRDTPNAPTEPIAATVPTAGCVPADFTAQDGLLQCSTAQIRLGIDVSRYQGQIDWQQVKAAGIEFVMVRLGYRGIGDGLLHEDPNARANLLGARQAGLLVGAYFYSQAVSPEEAGEEAIFALEILGDFVLDLPLAYDWECESRTENVDVQTATACAAAFCDAIAAGGCDTMIYFNSYQAAERLDLLQLREHKWWLALYDPGETFPCRFDMWQYTQTGTVAGIEGYVDINVWLI